MRLVITAILISVFLNSCKSDKQLREEAAAMAQEQFKNIDRSAVDKYPLFPTCDELAVNSYDCFYATLDSVIVRSLKEVPLELAPIAQDTIMIAITIDATGKINYDRIINAPSEFNEAKLNAMLGKNLDNLPQIEPALKQDIPVASTYKMPIVFKARQQVH